MGGKKIAKADNSKIKKKAKRKGLVGTVYKRLTIIFGIATFVFGIASVALTIYSIDLQQRESASRKVLQKLKDILTALSDTTSNSQLKRMADDIKKNIPDNYKHYVRFVGSMVDSLEIYQKKLAGYERRITKSLMPNQTLRKKYPVEGWTAERALFFEIIDPIDSLKPTKGTPTYVLVKLKISPEEVYCLQIRLASEKFTLGIYSYQPQGIYNKLEIPEINIQHASTAHVGIYLKEDTLERFPRFYRKEVKVQRRNGIGS